jgi:hypothetical protein
MAYTLVGNCYIGSGSLPTPVVGYDAIDTSTGDRYTSNTASAAWVLIGNVNNVQLGALPITGGTMTGAIAGASGWAPNAEPNFTTSAKLDGVDLATATDLSDMSTSILNSISPKITEAVASTSAGITVKSNIAIATGILYFPGGSWGPAQTIPLPVYPVTGITADEADCKWVVIPTMEIFEEGGSGAPYNSFKHFTNGLDTSYATAQLQMAFDPTSTRTMAYRHYNQIGTVYSGRVLYMIIAVKS